MRQTQTSTCFVSSVADLKRVKDARTSKVCLPMPKHGRQTGALQANCGLRELASKTMLEGKWKIDVKVDVFCTHCQSLPVCSPTAKKRSHINDVILSLQTLFSHMQDVHRQRARQLDWWRLLASTTATPPLVPLQEVVRVEILTTN